MSDNVEKIKRYLQSLGFDIDLEIGKYKDIIEKCANNKISIDDLVYYVSDWQNCGGYALEIPICVFESFACESDYTFEENVLRIQELYPFVRLLSQGDLKENEYVVLYRAGNKVGHHFVKINDTGEMVEKDGPGLPQKFNGWNESLKNAPEAVFAVLKSEYRDEKMKELPQCNRNMCLYNDAYYIEEDGYKDIAVKKAKRPLTFDRRIKQAYDNNQSSFTYNNKEFYIKVNSDENDLIYIYDEDELLGIAFADDESCIMELKEKNKVYGFKADISNLIKKETQNLEI